MKIATHSIGTKGRLIAATSTCSLRQTTKISTSCLGQMTSNHLLFMRPRAPLLQKRVIWAALFITIVWFRWDALVVADSATSMWSVPNLTVSHMTIRRLRYEYCTGAVVLIIGTTASPREEGLWIFFRVIWVHLRPCFLLPCVLEVLCIRNIIVVPVAKLWHMRAVLLDLFKRKGVLLDGLESQPICKNHKPYVITKISYLLNL